MVRRILALLALVAMFVLFQAPPALADDQVVVEDATFHQVQVLSVLVGTILPLLVGLVTKTVTSEKVKALILAGLSAATAILTEAINVGGFGDQYSWQTALLTFVVTFITAVGFHLGFWKPTGAAARAQAAGPIK